MVAVGKREEELRCRHQVLVLASAGHTEAASDSEATPAYVRMQVQDFGNARRLDTDDLEILIFAQTGAQSRLRDQGFARH
jgi:hypothetical protein